MQPVTRDGQFEALRPTMVPPPAPHIRLGVQVEGPITGPNSIWPTVAYAGLGLAAFGFFGWALFG